MLIYIASIVMMIRGAIPSSVARPNETVVYYLRNGPKPRICARRTVDCAPKHTAASLLCHVQLNGLSVDPNMQHPAFVVTHAQAQLLLLMRGHLSVEHKKSLFSFMSTLPLGAALKRCYVMLFCLFDVPLLLNFFVFAVLFFDIVPLRA